MVLTLECRQDVKNDRVVALKVIDVDSQDYKVNTAAKDNGIQETLHEIRVLQQLKDSKAKNINLFFDAFQIHSQLWIVNDYCPGGSVRTLVSSQARSPYVSAPENLPFQRSSDLIISLHPPWAK